MEAIVSSCLTWAAADLGAGCYRRSVDVLRALVPWPLCRPSVDWRSLYRTFSTAPRLPRYCRSHSRPRTSVLRAPCGHVFGGSEISVAFQPFSMTALMTMERMCKRARL